MRGLIAVCVRNPVFANLLAAGLLVGGFVAATQLSRETFPETAIDYVVITVPYPGANPEDIELSVCIKIEQAIEGIPGLGEIASLSTEDSGKVVGEFNPSITPTQELLRQIQDRVNSIVTFPKETERPIVTELIVRNHVINVGVHGAAPERTMKRVAEDLRRRLLTHPALSQVSLSGVRQYEISIQLTENTLKRYGLTLQQVIDAVSQGSLDLPAGTLRTKREEINIRTIGQRYTAHDFEDLPVISRVDGTLIRLGQLAQVRDTFEEMPVFGRINGEPGAMISISKTGKEDISEIAHIVRDEVMEARAEVPEGIQLSIWGDASRDVDARLEMLVKNGLLGMALVIVCLLLFMDMPSALAVSLGIPVSFAGALAATGMTGGTLNMISLLGLLMAVGIIVDDAIVIAESVRAGVRQGLEPALAAVDGTHQVALPVLTSSATTIVAFIPLMYVEGVMGKLIYVLPVVMIAAIVASAVEAFVILPAHLREWAANPSSTTATASWRRRVRQRLDTWIDNIITRWYRPILHWALARRGLVLSGSITVVLVCAGLVFGGRTPFVLFPKIDTNSVRARLRFPEGTPIEVTQAAVTRMERAAFALNEDPQLKPATDGELVQHVYGVVGEWPDFATRRGSSLCEASIELMPAELRRLDVAKIIEHWRRGIGDIPDAVSMTIARQQLGPTDKPIEIRLLSEELEELRQAADEVRVKLAGFQGVFDIDDDLTAGKRELRVSLKPRASTLGLTVAELASQLRQGLYGGEAVRLQRGADEVKVMVSLLDPDRRSLGAIENLRIRTRTGAEIPFREVAETELVRGYSTITRQDGKRRVRIQADIDERFANAERIVADLARTFLPELDARYPRVTYRLDGQRKRIDESMRSLIRASTVAGVVMFGLLGTVLRSYAQPIIIMAAVPLGMVGAVLGHGIMGYELTLMSVFGMVALAGIVVNDSLVLVDRINKNIAGGASVSEAVAQAGESRFRAVTLTTVTTVAGLLPLLAERSSQAQSLIPLAISIAFGELFGTVLTLLIVPVLFLVVNDVKRFAHWLRHGGAYPAAEVVEQRAREHAAATR
ncbi:MAG: efflux RND transporter permease subunit [Planctomycetota bacterium]|jgi:multidrug efflux pump subunit AcrB